MDGWRNGSKARMDEEKTSKYRVAMMNSRLCFASAFGSILLASVCFLLPTACRGQEPGHHAPWNSPVAWSHIIRIGGGTIRVDIAPGPTDLSRTEFRQWVKTAARAVTEYYGRFPVPRARVLILPVADRRGVLSGTTWGDVDGFAAFTRMRLGQHTTRQDLLDDWTMTHEFVHTALPSLSRNHHWLEEGSATYVEPIARAQIGTLTPEFVWEETVQGMPKGEPQPGEEGLDMTHTWAATYWGGALFWMVADVKIREATGNRKGLQDALRGILASGGSIAVEWPISRVFSVADQATGTAVLADLYKNMGEHSFAPVDLDTLWKQLGILPLKKGVAFNDQAPLATIRKEITAPERSSPKEE